MPKYLKGHTDVAFYLSKRKKIAGSTTATNDFLVIIHEDHPEMTISQLKELLLDKTKFIYHPEAIAVLDAYIKAGEGDTVPRWC